MEKGHLVHKTGFIQFQSNRTVVHGISRVSFFSAFSATGLCYYDISLTWELAKVSTLRDFEIHPFAIL